MEYRFARANGPARHHHQTTTPALLPLKRINLICLDRGLLANTSGMTVGIGMGGTMVVTISGRRAVRTGVFEEQARLESPIDC